MKPERFINTPFGSMIKSVAVGAIKGISGPLGGFVDEVITNVNTDNGTAPGKVNWSRLVGYLSGTVVFIFLVILLIKDIITIDELKTLWKLFD